MIRLRICGLVLVLAAAAVAGCDSKGVTRPPPTSIIVLNAAPSYGALDFWREQPRSGPLATLPFGEGTAASFDSGPYDFNIEYSPGFGGSFRVRLETLSKDLPENALNVFVLAEDASGFAPFIVEAPTTTPAGSDAQTLIIHASSAGASYDVYLEPEGTDLLTATPLGTLAYGQNLPPATRPEGGYRLYLTAPGMPTDVRFESTTFTLPAGSSSVMAIKDEGGVGLGTLDLLLFGTSGVVILDANVQSSVRVINTVVDQTARDFTLDAAYMPPLFPDVAYGVPSDYAEVAPGAHALNVTPVGNPVDELTAALELSAGRAHTILVSGNTTDGLARVGVQDDLRHHIGESAVRLMNGAYLLGTIEFYLAAPGTSIDQLIPLATLAAPGIGPRVDYAPGDYELTLRDFVTRAIVAGPTTVTLESDGFYEILATDAVGGSTADLVYLGDFN